MIFYFSVSLLRFDDMYTLVLHYTDHSTNTKREDSLTKSVGSWFDENGLLEMDVFISDVNTLHSSLISDKKQKWCASVFLSQ